MYRNYIFDFYGTLADIRTDEENPFLWKKMSEIYSALGASYEPEELRKAFRRLEEAQKEKIGMQEARQETIGKQEARQETIGKQEARQETIGIQGARKETIGIQDAEPDLTKVFGLLYQEKNVSCDAGQARMTAITFRALSREFLRAYDGVEELLKELRRQGKGVYLLSNAQTDFTRPEIEMLGLTDYFDGIFISSEQGCKKPSPLFFERLLERYGLEPSESIMIGNDRNADIAGACHVGMDSLYIYTDISPKEDLCEETCPGRRATYYVMDGDFRKIRGLILRR